jgi:microcin C transport system ATP-binding protein
MQSSPLLTVSDLSIGFAAAGGESQVVHNVNFELFKGKTTALVGESGSGKSITALSILGLLPYPIAYHSSGSIKYHNKVGTHELLNLGEKKLQQFRGKEIAMVFQEPLSALNPLHTIEQQIAEPLHLHTNMNQAQIKHRVKELLDMVEFKDGYNRLKSYPHELSGGQRQRVMIAMALACDPKILIADEPTTALDVTIQKGIINLIKRLSASQDMGILLISHDLKMVNKLADDVCIMQSGSFVETGPVNTVLKKPQHPYSQKLIASEPSGQPAAIADNAPVILTTNSLRVEYPRKKLFSFKKIPPFIAVNDVSLSLKQGETLGIVGESGSGKTTLAFALLNLLQSKGTINFNDIDIKNISKKEMRHLRQFMQVIFQDPFGALNPRFSIRDIIGEGLTVHEPYLSKEEQTEKIVDVLKEVDLDPQVMNRYPHEFSGGQRQRIGIARSIILKPKLLTLDEPTSALDRSVQSGIIDLLRKLQKQHTLSYLFISHDLSVVRAMSHRIIVMKDGKILEHGLTDNIINNPQHTYTKQLIDAAFG